MTDAAPPTREPGSVRAIGRGAVGAIVVLAVVLGAVWWSTSSDEGNAPNRSVTSSPGPPFGEVERDERASAILRDLGTAWARGNEAGFVAAVGDVDAARQWASGVYDALDDLRVQSLDLRYVAVDPETAADPDGFTADVEVRWEIAAGQVHQTYRTIPVTVPLRFSYTDDALALIGLDGSTDDPVPVWLTGTVAVDASKDGTCVGVPDTIELGTCVGLLNVAADDLARVLSTEVPRQPVVVMVPATVQTAAMLLGQDADDLEQIAAVTATIDGSGSERAPAQIVVNPGVFDDLNRRAAQLVMSHEATHAATGATAAPMELWVAEGFADYVALASERIPVERAASQILDYVRKRRAPNHLPTAKEFSAHRHGLGRTYEAAWLIFRMLDSYYGNDAVVAFYDAVRTGTPIETALIETIGIDLRVLTDAWREYLDDLALGTY